MNISFFSATSQMAFAPIDLKNAKILLIDGFVNGTESPTVLGAESIGSTLIEITDGTMEKQVPIGAKVKFAGDTTKYTVNAVTLNVSGTDEVQTHANNVSATAGTYDLLFTLPTSAVVTQATVSITGLVFNATSSAVQTAVDLGFAGVAIDAITYTAGDITVTGGPITTTDIIFTFDGASVSKRNWPLTVADETNLTGGTPTGISETTVGEKANSTDSFGITPSLVIALSGTEAMTFSGIELVVTIGTGNITYDETRDIIYDKDRGILDGVRLGDEQEMAVTLSFTWEFLEGIPGGTPSVEDALKRQGAASIWTSTNPDACAPFAVDIEIDNRPVCTAGTAEETTPEQIFLRIFNYTSLSHDGTGALVSIEGTCNTKEADILRAA